jgi:hypothetical protein
LHRRGPPVLDLAGAGKGSLSAAMTFADYALGATMIEAFVRPGWTRLFFQWWFVINSE